MVHSVIIGVSLGASQSPNVVKYLVTALTFHQFFEGMGLGGCISQVLNLYIYKFIFLFYAFFMFIYSRVFVTNEYNEMILYLVG